MSVYRLHSLTTVQVATLDMHLPHNVVDGYASFKSEKEVRKCLTRMHAEAEDMLKGDPRRRSMLCLIRKLERMMLDLPNHKDKPIPGQHQLSGIPMETQIPQAKLRENEFAVTMTIAQTKYLRDTARIDDVRWASLKAQISRMFVDRARQASVVRQLKELYLKCNSRHAKLILTTAIKNIEASSVAPAKKTEKKSTPKRVTNIVTFEDRACLTYVCGKLGIEVKQQKRGSYDDIIYPPDIPDVIAELRKMASMVRGTTVITDQIIARLQVSLHGDPDITPMKIDKETTEIYVLTAADLEDQGGEQGGEYAELLSSLGTDPLVEKPFVQPDYSELEGAESVTGRYNSDEDASLSDASLSDASLSDASLSDASLSDEDMVEYVEGDVEDNDEDDEDGAIIISDMSAVLEYFGSEELEEYGALDWEDEKIIFLCTEDRDAFCDFFYDVIDAEIASGKLFGEVQADIELELRTLSSAAAL